MSEHASISPIQPLSSAAAKDTGPRQEPITKDVDPEILYRLPIQFKLSVGASDYPLEQEADAMADSVMQMPERNFLQQEYTANQSRDKVQRTREDEETVQRKTNAPTFIQQWDRKYAGIGQPGRIPLLERIIPFPQAKKQDFTSTNDETCHSIQSFGGNGSKMSDDTNTFMSNRFGADFRNVKIHTDNEAIKLNRDLNANAFTLGKDIYFNEGQYHPHSDEGKLLLAHELTHVVQQGSASEHTHIQRKLKGHNQERIEPPVESQAITMPWQKSVQNTMFMFFRPYGLLGPKKLSDEDVYEVVEKDIQSSDQSKNFYFTYVDNDKPGKKSQLTSGEIDLLMNQYGYKDFTVQESETLLLALGYTWEKFNEERKPKTGKNDVSLAQIMDLIDNIQTDSFPHEKATSREIIMAGVPLEEKALVDRFLKDLEPLTQKGDETQKLKPYVVTEYDIKALRKLYRKGNEEQLKKFIATLASGKDNKNGHVFSQEMSLSDLIETVEAYQQMREYNATYHLSEGKKGTMEPPIVNRPVHGKIVAMNNPAVEGQELHFSFQVLDDVDAFKVPVVTIHWNAINKNNKSVDDEVTRYIDVRRDGLLNDRIFETKLKPAGEYIIHAHVYHNFYYPAAFIEPVLVVRPDDALNALRTQSDATEPFATIGNFDSFNFDMGLINDISSNDEGTYAEGVMTGKTAFGIDKQISNIGAEIESLKKLKIHYGSSGNKDYNDWIDKKLKRHEDTILTLQGTKSNSGNKEIQMQGFYISRTPGVESGPLKLSGWYTHDPKADGLAALVLLGHIFDRSDIVETENLHFKGAAFKYENLLESLFVELAGEYPKGNLEITFQVYDSKDLPTNKTITFRKITDTVWKDIKEVAYSLPVQIIVNVVAGILTVFPPTTAIGITLGVVYNGAQAISDLASRLNTGRSIRAEDILNIALVALDVVPILGLAATEASAGIRILKLSSKIGGIAGNLYIVGAGVVDQISKVRDNQISRLADIYNRVSILQQQHAPSDLLKPELDAMRQLEAEIKEASVDITAKMLATQAAIMGVTHLATSKVKGHLENLTPAERLKLGITDTDLKTLSAESEKRATSNPMPGAATSRGLEAHPTLKEHLGEVRGIAGIFSSGQQNHEMKVRYEIGHDGVIKEIFIEAGINADVTLLKQHIPTIRSLQKYQNFSGKVRSLLIKLNNLYASLADRPSSMIPLPGSRAFEAKLEIEKLPGIIQSRAAVLSDSNLSVLKRSELEADIAFLEAEMVKHNRTLDILDMEIGVGFVASKVPETDAKAVQLGYPKPPAQHYYYLSESGRYQLRRFGFSDAPPQRVVEKAGKFYLERLPNDGRELSHLEVEAKAPDDTKSQASATSDIPVKPGQATASDSTPPAKQPLERAVDKVQHKEQPTPSQKPEKPLTEKQKQVRGRETRQRDLVKSLYDQKTAALEELADLRAKENKAAEDIEEIRALEKELDGLDPNWDPKQSDKKVGIGKIREAEHALTIAEKEAAQSYRTLYDRLRSACPSEGTQERTLRGKTKDQVGELKTKRGKLTAEHIVSVREIADMIVDMDPEKKLTWEEQKAIVDLSENMIAMDENANSSKSSRRWTS